MSQLITSMFQSLITKLLIIIVVVSVIYDHAFADDKCSDILAQGIKDEFNFTSNDTIEDSTYKVICNKNYSNNSDSSGFSINIPIPEIKNIIGLGASDNYNSVKRAEFCSNSSSSVSRNAAINFAKKIINQNVVKAWESCMSSKGLYCEAENIGDKHFRLKVSWAPSIRADEPKIESDLAVVGGSCNNITMLKSGRFIREKASISEVCERDTNNVSGQIFACLNTTQGSVDCIVPKIVVPLKPSEYLQACIDGNYEGCAGLQLQDKRKQQACMDEIGPAPQNISAIDAQNRAVQLRNCGNMATDARIRMLFIEDIWRYCNPNKSNSTQCDNAKLNLSTALSH